MLVTRHQRPARKLARRGRGRRGAPTKYAGVRTGGSTKMRLATLLSITLAASLAGCSIPAAQYKLTTSAAGPVSAKSAACDFRVVNTVPEGYQEIGTLSIDWDSGGTAAMDPDDFKRRVQGAVCHIGGELVVTEINGFGAYVRGTVMRRGVATN
jgi:hypothetical protein